MGFLSGVLGAVKDDDAVETYDRHLNKRLNDVLNTLTQKIGSGRAGLAESVAEVKGWLEGYNDEVGKKTKAVTSALNTLSGKLNSDSSSGTGKYFTEVSRQSTSPLAEQLGAWRTTVRSLETEVNKIQTDNINVLDTALKRDVLDGFMSVKSVVAHMKRVSDNGDLAAQTQQVDNQLKVQQAHIMDTITAESENVKSSLQKEFDIIFAKMKILTEENKKQNKHLRDAVNDAMEDLARLNENYKNEIGNAFHDITRDLRYVNPTDRYAGGDGTNSRLWNDVNDTRIKLMGIHGNLESYVEKLEKWMTKTTKNIDEAKEKYLDQIIDNGAAWDKRHEIEEQVAEFKKKADQVYWHFKGAQDAITALESNAQQKVEELENKMKENLGNMKTQIKNQLEHYIKHIMSAHFNKIKEGVGKDSKESSQKSGIFKNWSDLGVAIHGIVDEMYDKDGRSRKSDHLGKIKKGIATYAEKFKTNEMFATKVLDDWMGHIVENESVKGWLKQYIEENKNGYGYFNGDMSSSDTEALCGVVTSIVQKHIKDKLKLIQISASYNSNLTVDKKVLYIKNYLSKFSSSIMAKEGDIISAVDSAVKQDQRLVKTSTSAYHRKGYLTTAVKATLIAIQSIAKRLSEQFDKLSDASDLGGSLQGAITSVAKFGEVFAGVNQPGRKITDALWNLEHNIMKLEASLDEKHFDDIVDAQLHDESAESNGGGASRVDITQFPEYIEKRNAVKEAIAAIKSELQIDYSSATTGVDEGCFLHLSSDITNKLKSLIKALAENGQRVHRYLYDLKTEYIHVQLAKIKNQINTLQRETLYSVMQDNINPILTKINQLDAVAGDVESKRQETVKLMETLKTKLYDNLKNISSFVGVADIELTNAIQTVRTAINRAYHSGMDAVQKLKNELIQTTDNAFKSITSEVRTLFADAHKADLAALKALVVEQTTSIETIINNDLKTGLKGLLKAMYGKDQKGGQLAALVKEQNGDYNVNSLSRHTKAYVGDLLQYLFFHILKERDSSKSTVSGDHADEVKNVQEKLTNLLDHLINNDSKKYNYDNKFVTLLSTLSSSLAALSPSTFANPPHPELLDAVKKGLEGFVKEMERVYVNGYDDGSTIDWSKMLLIKAKSDAKKDNEDAEPKEELTPYGEKLSKVLLTVIILLNKDLRTLKLKSEMLDQSKIHSNSELGSVLNRFGYQVSDKGKQNGELQNSDKMNGNEIYGKLMQITVTPNDEYNIVITIQRLIDNLKSYYDVCHLSAVPTTRLPCSIYEMLVWVAGLWHNPALIMLKNYIKAQFDEKDSSRFADKIYDFVEFEWYNLCSASYDLLIIILGTGNAHTIYGSDFYNNSLKLKYPGSGQECFDIFIDVLRRLFPVLQFLYVRCDVDGKHGGWRECQYGRDVLTTKSQCYNQSVQHAACEANCSPTCQAKCKSNYQPNCQPTSPLMSYFYDCLPGHLPHNLTTIGCKYECVNCPTTSKKGMPCLTPLGFRGFSGSTRTGKNISDILAVFFKIKNFRTLFALAPKPPSTLSEHFSFVLTLAAGINDTTTKRKSDVKTLRESFEESIDKQSIKLYENAPSFTSALRDAYRSNKSHDDDPHPDATNADLFTLCMNKSCVYPNLNVYCGPYLYSLSSDSYSCLANKHSGLYLSWALYLPWTFYQYLKSLLDAFCSISCQNWGCRNCLKGDTCKPGKHGVDYNCKCNALVRCRGVISTFYSYGFTFGDAKNMMDGEDRRYCRDFCSQLTNVLKSDCFKKLFAKCDNFLWQIRQPFSYLVLALWLLSFLYLLHIMIIRLDLLHIKSHLHSPSSHRIAAQSLLAAARVNKLNRVFYLQP